VTISPERDENRFPSPAIRISAGDDRSGSGRCTPSPLPFDRTASFVMIPIFINVVKYFDLDQVFHS
jgi:hypothetical protein